jgi:TPR repeat protein
VPAWAATVEQGLAAFQAGDPVAARKIWLPLSEAGDPRATYYMSLLYAQGRGAAENHALAMEFLAAAARAGHVTAQFNLGNHYNTGKWVTEDPVQAAFWWRRAAAAGLPRAQHNLATLYLMGRGVEKDLARARYWYERAARSGAQRSAEALREIDTQSANASLDGTTGANQGLEPQPRDGASAAHGHAWLQRQPGNKYTLQVFASESRDTIGRLLAKYEFKREVCVYRFKSRGRVLYAMSYGDFPTATAARQAVAELPRELQRSAPWPRRFADIQGLIGAAGE